MSNRKRPEGTQPFKPVTTTIPSIYITQFQYSIDGGMITLDLGRTGTNDVSVTMGINLFIDMLNKVQATVIGQAKPEEMKP